MFKHLFRCEHCEERFMVIYDWKSALVDFWRVQAEIASVETSFHVHRTNHVLDKMKEIESWI